MNELLDYVLKQKGLIPEDGGWEVRKHFRNYFNYVVSCQNEDGAKKEVTVSTDDVMEVMYTGIRYASWGIPVPPVKYEPREEEPVSRLKRVFCTLKDVAMRIACLLLSFILCASTLFTITVIGRVKGWW